MKTAKTWGLTMKALHSSYYQQSPGRPPTKAEVIRNVREFRKRLFHWPERERGIPPGRGNRSARRFYKIFGDDVFYGIDRVCISARRLRDGGHL